jgi:hypothetical protein
MNSTLPEYFFRIRDNGAQVFRIDTKNQHHRLEFEPIAFANVRNGEIRPQGDRELSEHDLAEIERWLAGRRDILAKRELQEIEHTIEQLNLTAHWANSKADAAALEQVTDRLLLAMHDLRSVLVRKKADALSGSQAG